MKMRGESILPLKCLVRLASPALAATTARVGAAQSNVASDHTIWSRRPRRPAGEVKAPPTPQRWFGTSTQAAAKYQRPGWIRTDGVIAIGWLTPCNT